MRLSALPPVRRAVPLKRGTPAARLSMERFFGHRRITLYASGTAALAEAIAHCAARSSASAPEVIIPAYGCPDLVAACLHASVFPRLVDVAPSQWSYDLAALESSLSPRTVAIVAVNLLGLGDGARELIRLCEGRRIPLIQDSAQCLPRAPADWPGEYVILSFGRGKPLNLLHGGALIAPPGDSTPLARPGDYTWRNRLLATRGAAVAFNVLTRPHVYPIFAALAGNALGSVVYKPLHRAALLPERAWNQVGTAFELYRRTPSYRRDIWTPALEEWARLGIVELRCPGSPLPPEPLRLALLAPDRAARDTLVDRFNRAGLGASRFYGSDLSQVMGIPEVIRDQGPFANASSLADRLLTLPSHDLVSAHTVEASRTQVRSWHRARCASPTGSAP
ncbi:MAG: DegT/DnrJ/EryC1/StrS family aminotransferase [Steroidobacteraceae bacterium]